MLWLIVLLTTQNALSCTYLARFHRNHLRRLGGVFMLSQLLIACSSGPVSTTASQSGKVSNSPPLQANPNLSRTSRLTLALQTAFSVPLHTASRVSPLIIQSADFNGVSPYLLAAVIHQESSYNSDASSPAGAVGLTQVMPKYWKTQCPGNLYDDTINIQCGSQILSAYNKSAGSWPKALAYYNVGPYGYHSNSKMKKQGEKYARSVEQHYQHLINTIQMQTAPQQQRVTLPPPITSNFKADVNTVQIE